MFKTLPSLYGWAGWFESCLVGNPEDKFSRDGAHILLLHFYKNFYVVLKSHVKMEKPIFNIVILRQYNRLNNSGY